MEYVSKRFLSATDGSETGSIVATVSQCDAGRYNAKEMESTIIENGQIAAELIIRDCFKQVTLDFCSHTANSLAERIEKVNVLVDEITKFRDALVKATEEAQASWLKYEGEKDAD